MIYNSDRSNAVAVVCSVARFDASFGTLSIFMFV